MQPVLSIRGLSKSYKGGLQALKTVDLDIQRGEIFALLGPNGAGKTTLINAVCGIVTPTTGQITAAGYDTREGISRRALAHRPRAAGNAHRHLRDGLGRHDLLARPVRPAAQSTRTSSRC